MGSGTISFLFPRDVILAGQYLGAQLENDAFFPPWKLQRFYDDNRFSAFNTADGGWKVTVKLPSGESKSMILPVAV